MRLHVATSDGEHEKHKIGLSGRFKLLVFKLGYGHVGALAAVGGYFFVTQLLHGQHTSLDVAFLNVHTTLAFPDVKGAWDHLLDASAASGGLVKVMSHHHWNSIRHLIRPLYEGIFGGLLFALVSYNPYKAKIKSDPPFLSRVAIRLRFIPTLYRPVTAPQIVLLPLTITLFSLPGVALGYGVDQALRSLLKVKSLAPTLHSHPSVAEKFYSGSFDAKIIGLVASVFFARRAALPVFNFVLRYFAQRRALADKRTRLWHPPAYKLLVHDYANESVTELERKQGRHSTLVRVLVPLSALIVAGLAGLGYWVLRFVAGA